MSMENQEIAETSELNDVFSEIVENDETDTAQEGDQFLVFKVRGEKYGFPVETVREVLDDIETSSVPKTPSYIHGVLNVRGKVIPVIDLGALFGISVAELTRFSCIIIIEYKDMDETILLGALIDEICSVVTLPEENIQENPGFGAKVRTEFIQAIGKHEDEFIVLLNEQIVFNINELSNFEGADDKDSTENIKLEK